MNSVDKILNNFFQNIYDINNSCKNSSEDFSKLLNTLRKLFQNINLELYHRETLDYLMINNNNESIIHFIIDKICNIKLNLNINKLIYINNRTDINVNQSITLYKNEKKFTLLQNKLICNNFNYIYQLTYFLFILLLELDNHILKIPNNNNLIPLNYLDKKKNFRNSTILQLLFIYGKNLVIIQQAIIRRYLAKRYVIKLKKQNCFNCILYSPPGQIELNYFNFFPGGSIYNYKLFKFNRYKYEKLLE